MKLDRQKMVTQRFEEMFKKGQKPWEDHPIEPLFHKFFTLITSRNPKAKLLDVGCGSGWASIFAAKRGIEAWGIDTSPTGIEEAKQKTLIEGLSSKTHFDVGDVLDLPYEDNFFDVIIDGGLFHHILPENRDLYLQNISRVIKRKGLLYLSAFSKDTTNDIGYHFTIDELKEIFEEDFEIVEYEKDKLNPNAPFITLHVIFRSIKK